MQIYASSQSYFHKYELSSRHWSSRSISRHEWVNPYAADCYFGQYKMMQKSIETWANGYPSASAQWELSNEYHHDKVKVVFKNISVLVLCTKVASALEGLKLEQVNQINTLHVETISLWQVYYPKGQGAFHTGRAIKTPLISTPSVDDTHIGFHLCVPRESTLFRYD